MGMNAKEVISSGRACLGIELGSTRIKAILIDPEHKVIAQGSHDWENRLVDGLWTYSLEDVWTGLKDCYADLKADVEKQYSVKLTKLAAAGFSAMMHGYMAFDKEGRLLIPFRTWRNTNTGEAAAKLTELFNFNMPMRWSTSHLYQCILEDMDHVKDVDFFTTLSGYVTWALTGNKVIGVGDAAGMFPIDPATKDFDAGMIEKFDSLVADKHYPWKLKEILPKVLVAGETAGILTKEGALLLDPSGELEAGTVLAPPEGDAGTGMVATNSCEITTGNVSAGTSVFAMVVMKENMKNLHTEIDMVTTPSGDPVAMVHCNNCTSDLNAWVGLFREFCEQMGIEPDMNRIFSVLYNHAMTGDPDCGEVLAYNYFSGEPVTGFMTEGRPLIVRKPDSKFNLANFMRANLYSSLASLKIGLDILFKEEHVTVSRLMGHGGLFKTKGVGQSVLAAAVNAPVTVMDTAAEGGAWGMAVLAQYMISGSDMSLVDYLNGKVFAGQSGSTLEPKKEDVEGFDRFIEIYKEGYPIEHAAVAHMV
jgi:sugar (pentulose or hexulose) kinase